MKNYLPDSMKPSLTRRRALELLGAAGALGLPSRPSAAFAAASALSPPQAGGLPADQAKTLAAPEIEVDPVERERAGEPLGKSGDRKERATGFRDRRCMRSGHG